MKKIRTIVFPVGGLGTRFLPATKATPKEMLPVAEKPLIQYAFEEAKNAGIERFIFVTGRNKNSIEDHFDNAFELQTVLNRKNKQELLEKTIGWMPKAGQIMFIRQQEPMGLGHAILCAKEFVGDEPFAVSLADEMVYGKKDNFLRKMMDIAEKDDCNVLGLGEVAKENVYKYGIVKPSKINGDIVDIENMVEKPKVEEAPSNLSLIGRYVLKPEVFSYLEKTQKGSGDEIQLTDGMKSMLPTSKFKGLVFKDDRFDCGSVLGYLSANLCYAYANPKIKEDVKNIINKFHKFVNEK